MGIISLLAAVLWSYGVSNLQEGLYVLMGSMIVTLVFTLFLLRFLPKVVARGNKIFLTEVLTAEEPIAHLSDLVNRTAKARTDLRPSGIIEIDGLRINAISSGDYIEASKEVKIIAVEGAKVMVELNS